MRMDTDKEFCRILIDTLTACGVRDYVCSPGSRNVPLLKAAFCRDDINVRMVTDERSAGYIALGIAMVARRAVVLICTSGTAMLNYAPAAAEAMYQGIPLILISADRPLQWIDQDDSQTIRQPRALDNFIKRSYDIPVENISPPNDMKWYVNRIANEALGIATAAKSGPVHINIQLDTPLGNSFTGEKVKQRTVSRLSPCTSPAPHIMSELSARISDKKILIVAGFMPPSDSLGKAVTMLGNLPNVYVMAETLSNLHLEPYHYAVDTALTGLTDEEKQRLRPDIVITLGGALVSRKIKEYLRRFTPREHWTFSFDNMLTDCFRCLTMTIDCRPDTFLKAMSKYLKKNLNTNRSSYNDSWKNIALKASVKARDYAKMIPWSEFKAYGMIFNCLPYNYNLFLSNGTPVRYAQLLTERNPHAVYGNRGTSGIEGTNSTALGCAYAYPGDTLLITGDLSFSYDFSILSRHDIPANLKIIVINNDGGGIFRFIPTTSSLSERETLFASHQKLPLEKLADAYGWKYLLSSSETEMANNLKAFFNAKSPILMEVKADTELSARILREFLN